MARRIVLPLFSALLVPACGAEPPPAPQRPPSRAAPRIPEGRPRRVVFEHILVSFRGAKRDVGSLRPREEAERLARSLLDRARSGVDFELLKQEFSDDRSKRTGKANGPYVILDDGVARRRPEEIPRANYARRPAYLLFHMRVGDIELAEYDDKDCPFGWHVLERIE